MKLPITKQRHGADDIDRLGLAFTEMAARIEDQLDKSRKSELGHSGLGLAITKKILELHDRSIDVASALGSGTTFSFQLSIESPA